ncbi:MAG: NUDIX domain-containing protein [Ignavibacteria bacterium]|nr:NUDIX domain-containing protein [Ignavibacteria bacterium]
MITKFSNLKDYGSVGIVFRYKNTILLVHPTDFKYNEWSYPKGHVENGENHKETAIREIKEELKVYLPSDFLDKSKEEELEPVIKSKGIKHYWFFRYQLNEDEFQKYFNGSFVIPKDKLQLEEVDEARFVDIEKAKKLLSSKFLGIL